MKKRDKAIIGASAVVLVGGLTCLSIKPHKIVPISGGRHKVVFMTSKDAAMRRELSNAEPFLIVPKGVEIELIRSVVGFDLIKYHGREGYVGKDTIERVITAVNHDGSIKENGGR